ncbi:hypothetical protein E4F39_05760 [Burkholderia pseudomallei]|nr:hypothetical protein E4F39_05760 [Burkholderia pseudomallei]
MSERRAGRSRAGDVSVTFFDASTYAGSRRIRSAGRPARVGQQGAPAARPVAVYGVVQEAGGAPRATGDARQAGARPAARRAQTTRLSLSAAIAASP